MVLILSLIVLMVLVGVMIACAALSKCFVLTRLLIAIWCLLVDAFVVVMIVTVIKFLIVGV